MFSHVQDLVGGHGANGVRYLEKMSLVYHKRGSRPVDDLTEWKDIPDERERGRRGREEGERRKECRSKEVRR